MRVSTTLMPAVVMMLTAVPACDNPEPLAPTAGVPAVAAAAKEFTTFEEPYAFELACPQGYILTNIGIATGHLQLLPAGSTPQRSELLFSLRGTLTNTTSGQTLRHDSNFTVFTDLSTGEMTASGGGFRIVAKGKGMLVLDAGTIRIDEQGQVTFEGGRHDFYQGEFEALECEALS